MHGRRKGANIRGEGKEQTLEAKAREEQGKQRGGNYYSITIHDI